MRASRFQSNLRETMAKFIWKEELTEEEFTNTFGENPCWVLSSGRSNCPPSDDKTNTTKTSENNSEKNS